MITEPLNQRLFERVVIAGAALGASKTPGDPFHKEVIVDRDFHHPVNLPLPLDEQRIQHLGLAGGTRYAIKDHTTATLEGIDPLADHRHDDIVGHELAGIHDGLGLAADLGALADGLAQHVAS